MERDIKLSKGCVLWYAGRLETRLDINISLHFAPFIKLCPPEVFAGSGYITGLKLCHL
jgi:hypothetical protein